MVTHSDPPYATTEYRTPVGTVTQKTVWTLLEGSHSPYEFELPFKSEKDYPIIEYLLANATVMPDFDECYRLGQILGEDGVIRAGLGYSPMQQIMRYWMGYERFF